MEEWLPVVGFEGSYEVSNRGRVRSLDRTVHRRSGGHQRLRGRLLAETPRSGRPCVAFSANGNKRACQVGVAVLEAFVGPSPAGMQCCHWDDNPMNNSVENLRWATPAANAADMLRNGRGQATKTSCPRGHDLFPPNLTKGHNRGCEACASTRKWATRHGVPADGHRWLAEAERRYAEIMNGNQPVAFAKRTHCPRGHELRRPNLVAKATVRMCLACTNTHKWGDYHGIHHTDPRWIAEADTRYGYIQAGLERPRVDQAKAECKRGHRLVPPNVIPQTSGVGVTCFVCTRTRSWAHYYKLRSDDAQWIAEADRRYAEIMSGTKKPSRGEARTECSRGHLLRPPNLREGRAKRCVACGNAQAWAYGRGIPVGDPRWVAEADRRYGEIMR